MLFNQGVRDLERQRLWPRHEGPAGYPERGAPESPADSLKRYCASATTLLRLALGTNQKVIDMQRQGQGHCALALGGNGGLLTAGFTFDSKPLRPKRD